MHKELWIATYIAAFGGTPFVTAALGYVVHYDFGFSRQEIRIGAMIAALFRPIGRAKNSKYARRFFRKRSVALVLIVSS